MPEREQELAQGLVPALAQGLVPELEPVPEQAQGLVPERVLELAQVLDCYMLRVILIILA